MHTTCLQKQENIKKIFNSCNSEEARYDKIMELGKQLKKMDSLHKTEKNIVKGCQSVMYLHTYKVDDKIFFEAEADALISLGLAALLILIYSGETAETILKCTPTCLKDLGIQANLSPNRANGLYHIHLKMKQEALKLLT